MRACWLQAQNVNTMDPIEGMGGDALTSPE
jgi:hypothetical protein